MSAAVVTEAFWRGCQRAGVHPSEGPVVVGISGGCDSMTLGHLLLDAGFHVEVAHVNYGLRADADLEEELVRQWCVCHSVRLHVLASSELTPPPSGRQSWARGVRYRFFQEVARGSGARVVMVGHHADDQLETLILHLARGTGPAGLAGMAPRRPMSMGAGVLLIRPLLDVSAGSLRAFAREANISWLEDASNQSGHYTRNAIRQELAHMDIGDLADLREAGRHLSVRIRGLREHIVRLVRNESILRFDDLDPLPRWIREWCLQEWLRLHAPLLPRRRSLAREIMGLSSLQTGRKVTCGTYTIWRERDGLRISGGSVTNEPSPQAFSVPSEGTAVTVMFGRGRFVAESVPVADPPIGPGMPTRGAMEVTVDASAMGENLQIRTWEAGDRFRPPGMTGRKKIKSFLTDRKVAASERRGIPVVADETGILWVAGQEIDARVRMQESTVRGIRLRWLPATADQVNG